MYIYYTLYNTWIDQQAKAYIYIVYHCMLIYNYVYVCAGVHCTLVYIYNPIGLLDTSVIGDMPLH